MIELLDIKVDVVFKGFFGDEESKEILESFINTILDLEGDQIIKVEEFLDPRKMHVEAGRPITFIDLSVKTRGGERYIIEMQTYNYEGFDKSLLYYLGKSYTEQIKQRGLSKIHVIAIIDFHRSSREKNGILNGARVIETYNLHSQFSTRNNHLFNQWKATLLDLKKFNDKSLKDLKTEKEKWFFLLNNASKMREQEIEDLKKEPVFQRALERLGRLSSDQATRKAYENSINEQSNQVADAFG